MINYLVINVMLSLSALAINYLMQIPHRIRFYILMIAVIGWLTPFALITIELTQQTVSMFPVQWVQLTETVVSNNTIIQPKFNFMAVLLALMAIGLIRFVMDIIATEKHIRKLKQDAKSLKNHKNIFMAQGISGAFVSGYFKPIIWIDEQLQRSGTLSSVIAHEQQHINSHDQFWLLIITLVQRLFWFNPLSLILSQKTRKGIELSCDEACKNKLGKSTYQSHLAQLIMVKHQTTTAVLNNQIHHDEKFNIHRIKQLNQENKMTQSHKTKLSLFAIMTLLMGSYTLVSVAHETGMPQVADNQVLLVLKIQKNDEEPDEISLLTNQGEMANVTVGNHDFGFLTLVIEAEPTQIYTKISISKIDNGVKTKLSNPAIMTLNDQWGGIKFEQEDIKFDINILAKTNRVMEPLAALPPQAPTSATAPLSVPAAPASALESVPALQVMPTISTTPSPDMPQTPSSTVAAEIAALPAPAPIPVKAQAKDKE